MGALDYDQLVGRIYEAAAIPGLWPDVLHEVAKAGESAAAALVIRREDSWVGWRHCSGFVGVGDYLASPVAAQSQTTDRLVRANHAGFLPDHVLFAKGEYEQDAYFVHYARPNGFHRGAASAIHFPTGDLAVVQLMRREGEPPFEPATIGRLDSLRPHLARAAMLAARWRLEQFRTAVAALEALGLSAAILGPSGRVLAPNSLFEAMSGQVIWLANDHFRFADRRAAGRLADHLARLKTEAAPVGLSFPLKARKTADAAIAHLAPVEGGASDLFAGGIALLVISPLQPHAVVDRQLVQGLFDLTPAETRVAALLLSGAATDEIAARQGVSNETIRAQIKSILSKSGSRRQAEFIAKFVGTALAGLG